MNRESIAKVCHEANKAFCEFLGDNSQVSWEEAPQWQRDSAINGVNYHLNNINTSASNSHDNWLREKIVNGWVYGKVKDPDQKIHPCIVSFEDLPKEQQFKDILFKTIVESLREEFSRP